MPLQHPSALPHQPTSTPAPTRPRTSSPFRSPIALSSYLQIQDTRAVRPGARPHAERCWAAVQWRRRSGRGADAVTVLGGRALPSAVTQARSGRPAGGRRLRGMSGRRPGRPLPCPRPRSRRETSVQPSSGHPVSRCPVSRHPVHQVSGRTGLRCPRRGRRLSAPRWALGWLGVAGGRPGRGQWSTWRRGRWAAGSPACTGPDGKRWYDVGHGWLARGSTVAQGRRLAVGPGRPGGEHGRGADAHRPYRVSWGRSSVWCLTMGLDRKVVTTLSGRRASGGPVLSSSGGPLGSVGEQPAAAARPRQMRSAVGQVLRGT
jgi:hypothetical protein